MTKEKFEEKFPVVFAGKANGFVNGVKGWHIENATPGLYTLDVEHIPENIVYSHNDLNNSDNVASRYRKDLCVHKCPFCFNEQSEIYAQFKTSNNEKAINKIMTLEETMNVIDQAIAIAKSEGHDFISTKFLGPGELLMNPDLFNIIEEYEKRNVIFNIFTKGALLGSDELAMKYQNMSAKNLVDKLASHKNVGLLMSFQSFDNLTQESLVTSIDENGKVNGIRNYGKIRENALENIFNSGFYNNRITDRISIINAPIVPENINESFDIYKFFTERGTPVVMTPSMLSGKGCMQIARQKINEKEWFNKLVELYAKIYAFNVEKEIQTPEQITMEGIASYVGAQPCNQVSTGLYIRANGLVQMCPGRFDKETIFGNLSEKSLKEIWDNSPNKSRGLENPHNLINNNCPAKDGTALPNGFYDNVMKKYEELTKK
jgi:MoaA/NifB/PqqE/SkfB family radical SAM enzyme